MPLQWPGNGVHWHHGAWALSNTKSLNGSSNSCALKPFSQCLRQALRVPHLRKTLPPPTALQVQQPLGHPLHRSRALHLF